MTICTKCGSGNLQRRRDGVWCPSCGKVFFGASLGEDVEADADREMGIADDPTEWGDEPFGNR